MVSMNFSNIAILSINNADYCCIITRISKSEAINLMQSIALSEKMWDIIKYKKLFSDTKNG